MSKIDEVKEEIGWLKIMFGILTAIDISLLGWLAQNYDKVSFILLTVTFIVIIISTISIVVVNKKAYSKMKQLKDL